MSRKEVKPTPPTVLSLFLAMAMLSAGTFFLSACGGSPDESGPSGYKPPSYYGPYGTRRVQDTTRTPPHKMSRAEYPFDRRGNYVR